jgi:hypothetical protein
VIARISLTHALLMFLTVLETFASPLWTASSMPLLDELDSSITFATVIGESSTQRAGKQYSKA